jgi:hypothetical protein
LGLVKSLAAAQDVHDAADHMLRVGALQIAMGQHWTDFDAIPTPGAVIQNISGLRLDIGL